MEHNIIKVIVALSCKCQRVLDVTGNLSDDEIEYIASTHVALLLTSNIAIFINHLFAERLLAAGMTIATALNHDQVVA